MGQLRYLWTDQTSAYNLRWMIQGGDTVIVAPTASGVGYNTNLDSASPYQNTNPGGIWNPVNCHGNPDCIMPSVPSGTATQHTRILGANYASCHSDAAKTQLNVSYGGLAAFALGSSQYVDIACFEITDKDACATNGAFTNACKGDGNNWGRDGIITSALSSQINISDVFIHGVANEGFTGAAGVGVVMDHVHIRGVPMAGVDMDDAPWYSSNISVSGGLTMNYSTTEFVGCVEEYPVAHNYPYIECRDQNTGAYGDGLGTGSTVGNWSFDHDVWFANFQDGLDLLHSGMQSLSVTNSKSIANDGQSYKIGSADNVVFRNNVAINNCARIGSLFGDEPSSAIVPGVTLCRAAGDGVLLKFTNLGSYILQDNTFVGYDATLFDMFCEDGWDFCNGAGTAFQNNVVLGYSNPTYDSGILPGLFYLETGQGQVFPNNSGWATRDHNLYYNVRYCPSSLQVGEKCNTSDPLFAGEPTSPLSAESALDGFDFVPSSAGPLVGSGIAVAGIVTDISGATRPNPPSIGASEIPAAGSAQPSTVTTVSLNATATSLFVGQAGTLTVSVASVNGVTPTGTITFYNGTASLGSAALNNTGAATLSTSSWSAGAYVVTAVYSGDSVYAPAASSSVSLTITTPPAQGGSTTLLVSTAAVSITPNPATVGQTVTFTGSVAGTTLSGVVPTGAVSFMVAGSSIGTAQLNSSGVATMSTASLAAGTYSVTISYAGDSNYAASTSSAVSLTIASQSSSATPPTTPQTSTLSLSVASNPAMVGQTVTLTGRVAGWLSGSVPTGTVSFLVAGSSIGSAQLNSSGVATLSTASLAAGTYAVTANYSGDGTYGTSTSNSVSLVVNPAASNAVSIAVAQPAYGFNVIPNSVRRIFATVTNGSTNKVSWAVKSGSAQLSSNSGSWVDVTAPATGSSCKIAGSASQYSVSSSAQFTIEATSLDDPATVADVTFNVCNPTVEISTVPFYRTVYANQPVDIQSLVLGATDQTVHWAITSQPSGGDGSLTDSTSRDTVFTATVAGRYDVTATSSANSQKAATAIVYVTGHSLPYRVTPNLTEPVDCSVDPSLQGLLYDVGPSQSFKTLAAVPFPTMPAGSTVRVHNEDTTGLHPTEYHEYVQISQAGTAQQPVRICGVADPQGNLPVIDASSATGRPDDSANVAGLGLITLHNPSYWTYWPNYSAAAYVVVEGLQLRNAKAGSSYTGPDGSQGQWSNSSSAIRIDEGQNIVFVGNDINNNSTGVQSTFAADGGWGSSDLNVLWEGNHIHNNGVSGSATAHQMDLQAWGEVVQFNRIDGYVSGGLGSNIKSRGIQGVIRYNYLGDGPARQIDLVDVQNAAPLMSFEAFLSGGASSVHANYPQDVYPADRIAAEQEAWNSHFVYGNIYQNSTSMTPIHFGEELSGGEAARKGSLYWYNNTFYQKLCPSCSNQAWTLFDTAASNGGFLGQTEFQTVQAINNIVWMDNPAEPVFQFNNNAGFIGVAGRNLLPANWGTNNTNGGSGTGWVASANSQAYQNAGELSLHLSGFTSSHLITSSTIPFDTIDWTLTSGVSGQLSVPSAVCEMPVRFAYLPSLGYVVPRTDTPNLGATDTAAQTATQMNAVAGNGRYHTRYSTCR